MPEVPKFSEIWDHYEFLRRVGKTALALAEESPPLFGFKQGDVVRESFLVAAIELDQAFTLTLFAAIEAGVRTHFQISLKSGNPGWFAVPAQALYDRFDGRVPLAEILDLWKGFPGAPANFGDKIGVLKQHYNRRHWLAHGRYFLDRSGLPNADPDSVFTATHKVVLLVPAFPIG